MVRIPPDLFIENLVIEHIMYIWRQALLQTRNGDNVALAVLHITSFLIYWEQLKRQRYRQKIINMHRTSLDIVTTFPRKGSICEWMANALHNAELEIRNVEDNILQTPYQASISKWTQVGDQANKMFFFQVAPKLSTIRIKQLRRKMAL